MARNVTLEQFCRLCLNSSPPYFSLFENEANTMLDSLTQIKISMADAAPTILCLQCLGELKNAYTIQQKFLQSHKVLEEKVASGVVKSEHLDTSAIKPELPDNQYPFDEMEDEQMSDENEGETDSSYKLPTYSKERYENTYGDFVKWCNHKDCKDCTEKVLLDFFMERAQNLKPSSLWALYSMLKSTIMIYRKVDISDYKTLVAFLKHKNRGYKPKKSRTFTREQINMFLLCAPDDVYLVAKVALIFGVAGSCSLQELRELTIDNIKDVGSTLLVTIIDLKRRTKRTFTIIDDARYPSFVEIYRKYAGLRPFHMTDQKRFFIRYREGKCARQVMGKNELGKLPKKIATFLKLPCPQEYTGHSFKHSSCILGSRVLI